MPDSKFLLGKLLGEIYRVERKLEMDTDVSDETIHGLLNGIESYIDAETPSPIGKDKVEKLTQVLNEYFTDAQKLNGLKGYYDIEKRLEELGYQVDRMDAYEIIRNLKAQGKFERVIQKFDSLDSPEELRTFKMDNFG
jgi:hypothetical protein